MNGEFDFQIIANLLAGKGEGKKKLELLKNFLKENRCTYEVTVIDTPTPISKIPKDDKFKIQKGVICIGGDGTVSETVGYVVNNGIKVPIAVIATGTANIIAGTLDLCPKEDSFDFLLADKTRKIDIGVAEFLNEKNYFLLGVGFGFEENFLRLTKEKLKSKVGILSYIFAALAELFSLKKIPITIENSSVQIKTSICLLTLLNLQPVVLKHFPLFKHQEIKGDDGIFNLYYVENKSYLKAFFGSLVFHIFGGMNFGLVKSVSGSEFSLDSPVYVGTQIDGELRSKLPVKISLLPRQIEFLI